MLTKLVDSTSFFATDDVQVTVLDPSSIDGLVKSAAVHKEIQGFVSTLVPEVSKAYLHINAMGAGEYYGANKNGDYFPEEQLLKYYKTFENTGYVYRHHINKDPAKSMGKVIFAVYNMDMHRVELIAEVDKTKAADILDRISMGDFPMTSMACRTPYDVCSICHNKAESLSKYCTHLKNELLKVHPDGRQVMALNVGPLTFFDISIVIRPADVTSSVLQKVASISGEQTDAATISSAEIAEREGIDEGGEGSVKIAAFKKLSELVKEIEGGQATNLPTSAKEILEQVQEIPLGAASDLLRFGSYNQVLNALAESGINPSSEFYMTLLHNNGVRVKSPVDEILDLHPDVYYEEVPGSLRSALIKYRNGSSLSPAHVEKRAYHWDLVVGNKPASLPVPHTPPKPDPVSGTGKLAATAAGAMVLNHLLDHDKEDKALIDKILSIFFGAALLSKLSVSELAKTHSVLNSSHSMNKQAAIAACFINDVSVLSEMYSLTNN